MRLISTVLATATLAACNPTSPQPSVTATTAAPFTIPMDPGQISCAQIGTPAALTAATQWAAGHARADLISGQRSEMPADGDLAAEITRTCATRPQSTIRAALS